MFGFTWTDLFAGYQAAGQAFITTVAWGVAVALMLAGAVWFAMWLDDRLGGGYASEEIRAKARADYSRPVQDWGADGIYPEREAS